MAEPSGELVGDRLLRSLRTAALLVAATVTVGLALPKLLAHSADHRSVPVQLAALCGMAAVLAVEAVLALRGRTWGAAAGPTAVAVLALGAVATAAMRPAGLFGPAHWSLGLVGWIGLVVLGGAVAATSAFLAVHAVTTTTQVVLADRSDAASLSELATVLVGVSSAQFAFCLAGLALRRLATIAAAAAAEQADLETADRVARAVHADREARYARLRGDVVPLLQALAASSASPADPAVQRRCAVAAARLRRMFGEDDDPGSPLAAEISALVDIAERRGVAVRHAVRGGLVEPPTTARAVMVDEVASALLVASGSARVTMAGTAGSVVVSVVAEGSTGVDGVRRDGPVEVTTVTGPAGTWVEARWEADR